MNFEKNHVFFKEGEASDYFYLIKEGTVEISKLIHLKREIERDERNLL